MDTMRWDNGCPLIISSFFLFRLEKSWPLKKIIFFRLTRCIFISKVRLSIYYLEDDGMVVWWQ